MKSWLVALTVLCLSGCVSEPRSPYAISLSPSSYLRPPQPNTAPRGSVEFCRNYGRQTAENRMRTARGFNGRGPNGMDLASAEQAGERAALRCASGRLN
ncbi:MULTISPECIES: hypothetical protein [unclassified Aureimonas]|uniref:hypothetical protein n=1 Tax=unclassified Aureimonas TaxID=2615206 RepID=UPI0006F7732A|nr:MULTISPECIES: hypothetical protein [unclassified Aureimonas]KQT64073.1 hypothetical protein ASG62_03400 [Aureimonas sp. Leaf427]KQT81265.1 hypothetical protein ASG54_00670 [Aureimonas sp. Leaf460]